MLTNDEINELKAACKETRRNILTMVYNAQSGHIGGSLSSVEIMAVLFHKCMKLAPKWEKDKNFNIRDRFVLSKGHVSPVYYSNLAQMGYFPKSELSTFRKLGSRLQGHPAIFCPGVDAATGSLGQGLSIACGMAMGLKLDNNPAKVFVLMGDGELQEGSVWEAFMDAPARKLDNLIAIIDRNCLQIDGNTENIKPLNDLAAKIRAFNWNVIEIDGHDLQGVYDAIELAKASTHPTAIIANTIKGKGVSFMENNAGWHGKAPKKEDYEKAMKELK